jgi:alkylation response protein AidB-like acyl-CoA dehydrogenase
VLVDLVRAVDREGDPLARQLLAEAHARRVVQRALADRLTRGMASGAVAPPAGAIMKLFAATNVMRRAEIGLELAGPEAVVWPAGDELPTGAQLGTYSLGRQGMSLGGGSNEMQRNIISERVLGLPREMAEDRDIPYREVRRGGGG